jgi:hypothetical protein
LCGSVGLLDRDGVPGLGGAVVFDECNGGVHPDGEFADESVVGAGVSKDPTPTVNVEDRGEWAGGADGLDDPHLHIADACRNGDPFLIHVELRDRRGLNIVQHLSGTFRAKVVKKWWLRRGICDFLGGAFKNGLHCVTSFHPSGSWLGVRCNLRRQGTRQRKALVSVKTGQPPGM